jgi:uncharacterized membrane protein YphA (DoxX/SURF4 family)
LRQSHAEGNSRLLIHFFGSSTCEQCTEIKAILLQPLAARYPDRIDLRTHDIDSDSALDLLVRMENAYAVPETSPQQLFLPDTFLTGYSAIIEEGEELILARLADTSRWSIPSGIAAKLGDQLPPDKTRQTIEAIAGPKTTPLEYLRDLGMLVLGIACLVWRRSRCLAYSGQVVLGMVFLIAGGPKLFSYHDLELVLKAYGILPAALVPVAARTMPWVEVVAGVSLLLGVFPRFGALVVCALHVGFIPALLYRAINVALAEQTNLFAVSFDCGCGLGENLAWVLILRDIGYLLIALCVLRVFGHRWDVTRLVRRGKGVRGGA